MLLGMRKFSKTTKLHKILGSVQFVDSEKLAFLIYIKLLTKSCQFLLIIHLKKNYRIEILTSHMLLVIYTCVTILLSCYNLNLFYMKNTLIFSQSEDGEFFMYIIKKYKYEMHDNVHGLIF